MVLISMLESFQTSVDCIAIEFQFAVVKKHANERIWFSRYQIWGSSQELENSAIQITGAYFQWVHGECAVYYDFLSKRGLIELF